MPRNDPTDTGGLFIGRRPGTGPLHFRGAPERGGRRRQRLDGVLAAALLVAETLLCLSVWGPQPLAWLWIVSQADYLLDSNMLGIVVAFVGHPRLAVRDVVAGLAPGSHLAALARRAAGHDQREGALARIFGASAVIALVLFGIWFLVIQGLRLRWRERR